MQKELQDILALIRNQEAPLVLATLLHVEGASYRRPGARLLTDGSRVLRGSLSGGCVEGEVLRRARTVLAEGRPESIRYDLRGDADLVWGSGSGCDGVLSILLERLEPGAPPEWMAWLSEPLHLRRTLRLATSRTAPFARRRLEVEAAPEPDETLEVVRPPLFLWILGAGDDSRALVRLAKDLGWKVGLLDHRPAFGTPERFPEADRVLAAHPAEGIPRCDLDERSAVVLMTHNYLKDLEALRLLVPSRAGYVGLMGSRSRGRKLLAELAGEGVRDDGRVHSPVGLDIGVEDPETIALSVLAEIQAAFQGRGGGPLRTSPRPISAP
jgi:xanthine/CO dehydrogenase XdhC/CoxF family maturation factor